MQTSKIKYIFSIFVLLGTLLFSCKHEDTPPEDVGYAFFPNNTGHWIVYDVDSTFYDDYAHTVKKYNFKLKEIIESNFIDIENRNTQRLERYKRFNDTLSWVLKDVWVCNLTPSTAEKVEENNRFVKLVFPIANKKKWNGNIFNSLGEQEYKYDKVYKPFSVNGFTFDSTITVIQKIDSNTIKVSYQIEIFAKHVGLIYKKYRELKKFYSVDTAIVAKDSIVSGVDYIYMINAYGN